MKQQASGLAQYKMQPSGLSTQSSGLAQYYEQSGAAKRGMVLPFQPLSMVFHNVWYSVDVPKVRPLNSSFWWKFGIVWAWAFVVGVIFSGGTLSALDS